MPVIQIPDSEFSRIEALLAQHGFEIESSMSKKDVISLADHLRGLSVPDDVLAGLLAFMHEQNLMFNEDRWMSYWQGTGGPSGGARSVPRERPPVSSPIMEEVA